jgi:hypothetical protein
LILPFFQNHSLPSPPNSQTNPIGAGYGGHVPLFSHHGKMAWWPLINGRNFQWHIWEKGCQPIVPPIPTHKMDVFISIYFFNHSLNIRVFYKKRKSQIKLFKAVSVNFLKLN